MNNTFDFSAFCRKLMNIFEGAQFQEWNKVRGCLSCFSVNKGDNWYQFYNPEMKPAKQVAGSIVCFLLINTKQIDIDGILVIPYELFDHLEFITILQDILGENTPEELTTIISNLQKFKVGDIGTYAKT